MNLDKLKSNKKNLSTLLVLGICLLCIGFIDIFSSTFLDFNITGFFPEIISFFSPLLFGSFGLYFIRIDE